MYVAIADSVVRVSERTRHRLNKQILISVSNVMQDQATGEFGLPISKTQGVRVNAAKSLLSTGRVPGWLSVRPAAHFKQLLSSESRHFRKIPPGCTVRRSKLLVQQHVECFLTL